MDRNHFGPRKEDRMRHAFPFFLACYLLVLATPAFADAKAVIEHDFATGVPEQWSTRQTLSIDGLTALGPFNEKNSAVPGKAELTLRGLPKRDYVLSFDLYLIGSWDSEGDKLADTFTLYDGNNGILLHMTEFPCAIANNDESRPVGHKGLVRTQLSERELGYWVVPVRIAVESDSFTGETLKLVFWGKPTARRVESWALANVRLERP